MTDVNMSLENTDRASASFRYMISFSLKRRRVLIHRSTLRALDMPSNIRFLLNTKNKRVAVQSCEAIDRDNFTVPDLSSMGSYEITSLNFLQVIYKLSGWDTDKNYRVEGCKFSKNHLVEFDLKQATIICDEDFVDPEVEGINLLEGTAAL